MKLILCIFAALAVLYFLLTWRLFLLVARRFRPGPTPLDGLHLGSDQFAADYPEPIEAGHAWLNSHTYETVGITSFDGIALRARLYDNPARRGVIVACHGYRSTGTHDFAASLPFYAERGFAVLLISQRASGDSDGKYITFGIRERLDVQDWCTWAGEHFPGLPVIPAGISMGASSVLMSADALPDCVPGLIADCGYVSPMEELTYVIHHFIHIPAAPLTSGIDFWARVLAGISLSQLRTTDIMTLCDRPVLLIHGRQDKLVPCESSIENAEVLNERASLFIADGADHGMSFLADNDGYTEAVDRFFRETLHI